MRLYLDGHRRSVAAGVITASLAMALVGEVPIATAPTTPPTTPLVEAVSAPPVTVPAEGAAVMSPWTGGAAPASATPPAPPAEAGIQVAPNPAAADVPAEMLAALQRDLKVTEEQARDRLVRSDWASRLDPLLRERIGEAYAGSWLATDGHEFVVAITDRRLEGMVLASGATPKVVARSELELAALSDRLAALARQDLKNIPAEVAGWVTDPHTNRIRIQVLPGGRAAAERFASAAGLAAAEVDYETVPARPTQYGDVKAGQGFIAAPLSGGAGQECTTGFAVTANPGTPQARAGYLTAAHCASQGAFVRNPAPGPGRPAFVRQGLFAAAVFDFENDEALVLTDPGFRPVPRVDGRGTPDIPVADGVEQAAGSVLCKAGLTTGMTCGIILPGQGSLIYPNGSVVSNLKMTDACAADGDSGGPAISGTHAQGLIVGGRRPVVDGIDLGCAFPALIRTHYVPLQRALNRLGARLRTVPAPRPPSSPPSSSRRWTDNGQAWDELGGAVQGKIASVSLNPGHLQIFGRGTDDRLHTRISANGMWGDWQSLGDVLTEPPTVLARAGGIDVYYRGADTRPYLRRFNGSGWEGPVRLGEVDVTGTIAAISPQPDHVTLFIRSSDDEIKYNFNNGSGWSGWLGLGGDANASPTAIARTNAAGQIVLEVYARWADDNVQYRRLDPAGPPGWQPWVNLGGIFKDTPVGVTVGPDQSWLIGWARDDTVHVQRWHNGSWLRGSDGSINAGWRGLGGSVKSPPTAIGGPEERIQVFARDADQRVNTIVWPGGDIYWENWTTLEGDTVQPVGVSPRTASDEASLIDAFGVDVTTQEPFHTQITAAQAVQVQVNTTESGVGTPAIFRVAGPPGAQVRWSSTKNGVPTGEDHAFYGQHLDGNGEFTWNAGDWPGSAVGSWVKQVHVGTQTQQTAEVAFTVAHRSVGVAVDRAAYRTGENITYLVSGQANQEIRWSSLVNGQPTAENNAFYGQTPTPTACSRSPSRSPRHCRAPGPSGSTSAARPPTCRSR